MRLRGDREKVTIYLSEQKHRDLKVEAARRGLSMSDVVEEALAMREQYVVRYTERGEDGTTRVKDSRDSRE